MTSTRGISRTRTAFIGAAIVLVAVVLLTAFLGGYLGVSLNHTTTSSSQSVSTSSTGSTSLSQSSSTTTTTTTTSTNSVSYANDWLTYHKDNGRSGYDASLLNITHPAVNWTTVVDAQVYAEPLFYVGSVYVATENNTVYALSGTSGAIQWSRHLGTPVKSLVPPFECNNSTFNAPDIRPLIGITGTPVIDPVSGTIYVAALISGTGYQLFALNANTGQPRWNATLAPSGFNYQGEEERSALTLANGLVYVPFGGFSWDCVGGNGWVVATSANGNGTQFNYKVPSNPEGDIWTPEGLSVDSLGFVYAVTGDSNNPKFDYGNSVIKLTPDLTFVSYFAAANWNYTNANDLDLGSTGATLLPGNLIFSIGKDGVGYLLNSSNLGGIGNQLFSAGVCTNANSNTTGAWGSTSFAQGIIYVPCSYGLLALKLQMGARPSFTSLWNSTLNFWATPPIIAAGAVWTFDVYSGTLYALNPVTGSLMYTLPPFIQPNSMPHFTTPSAGGGLLLFAENRTICGLNPT